MLRLGDLAPDFTADSTAGPIKFHDWTGDSWVILFSHPRDFTPVCTTELGYMAKLKPEFEKRKVKCIGLSIDPVESHKGWAEDIKETQGTALNFPIVANPQRKVADLYGMMHPKHDEGYTDFSKRSRSNLGSSSIHVQARMVICDLIFGSGATTILTLPFFALGKVA
jgi:alkyl hydroperoxide reductase subunit AhpC